MGKSIGKRNPGHIALRADYDEYRAHCSDELEDAAQSLGETVGRSRDWIYQVMRGDTGMQFTMLPAWINATGSIHALEWVCRQVGVIPVRITSAGSLANTAHTVVEFGEFLAEVAHAMDDGIVTAEEAARVRKEGEEAIAAILANIEQCESAVKKTGRFTTLADTQRGAV